ncbi:hypothetical protein AOLI_G00051970 [Acnodon oligacanthus]
MLVECVFPMQLGGVVHVSSPLWIGPVNDGLHCAGGAVCRRLIYRPQMLSQSASSCALMVGVWTLARWSVISSTTVGTTVMRRTAPCPPSTLRLPSSTRREKECFSSSATSIDWVKDSRQRQWQPASSL